MKCYIRNKDSFNAIISGTKTFEGRLYYDSWKSVKVRDIIVFIHDNNECTKTITKITLYNNITEFCEQKKIFEYKLLFDKCYSQNRQNKYKVIILDISD